MLPYLKEKDDHMLKVFENKILRRIFDSKRNENYNWRNKVLILLRQASIDRKIKFVTGHLARIGKIGVL